MKTLRVHFILPQDDTKASAYLNEFPLLRLKFHPYYDLNVSVSQANFHSIPVTRQENGVAWLDDKIMYELAEKHIFENGYPTVDIVCALSDHIPGTNWGIRRGEKHGTSFIQVFMEPGDTRPKNGESGREEVFVPYVAHEICHALYDLYNIKDDVLSNAPFGVHYFDYEKQDIKKAIEYAYDHYDNMYVLDKITHYTKGKSKLYAVWLLVMSLIGNK